MAIVLFGGASSGVFALADRQQASRVPRGVTIDGVDVGELTEHEAARRLRKHLAVPRPVRVRVAGRSYAIRGERAGVRIDYRSAIRRAIARGRQGSFFQRAWRDLASRSLGAELRAPIRVDAHGVRRAVARLASTVRRAPRDAALRVTAMRVTVRAPRPGLRLAHPERLARRVAAAFRNAGASHRLTAASRRIPAAVGVDDVRRRNVVVVTVSRYESRVRVFVHEKLAARYHAVAGTPRSPTTLGLFTVQAVGTRPAWIGFDGPVGFRPRGPLGSGRARGGIRMGRADLRSLSRHVHVGVRVRIAA